MSRRLRAVRMASHAIDGDEQHSLGTHRDRDAILVLFAVADQAELRAFHLQTHTSASSRNASSRIEGAARRPSTDAADRLTGRRNSASVTSLSRAIRPRTLFPT